MKRTAIKITLNSADVFDAVILEFLKDKKNKAGHLKKMVYDSIIRGKGIVTDAGEPERVVKKAEGDIEVNEKLSKMLNF